MGKAKLKWSSLFMDTDRVQVVRTETRRTFATDRYVVWDLDAVCAMFPADTPPVAGNYRVKAAKGMQPLSERGSLLNADGMERLFTERAQGVTLETHGLRITDWDYCPRETTAFRPLVDPTNGEVRLIDSGWLSGLPNFAIPAFTMRASDWDRFNVAVIGHGTSDGETVPLACVQLIGSYNTPERPAPAMARALAMSVGVGVDAMS